MGDEIGIGRGHHLNRRVFQIAVLGVDEAVIDDRKPEGFEKANGRPPLILVVLGPIQSHRVFRERLGEH